jgi:hypothetical protein
MTTTQSLVSLKSLSFEQNFPIHVHPFKEDIEEGIREICQRLDIRLPHYDEYDNMTCYVYPSSPRDRVITVGLVMNMMFYIDDTFEAGHGREIDPHYLARVVETCIKIICTGQRPEESLPLYDVALELHERLWKRTNPAWFKRWVNSLKDYMKSEVVVDSPLDSNGEIDIDKFVQMREIDSGAWVVFHLIEFANDRYLTEELFADEYMQRMMHLTAQIAALSNDLFSYEKEYFLPKGHFNLISVLMEKEQLSFQEAVAKAIDHINLLLASFKELYCNMPDYEDPGLNHAACSYVQGLWYIVSAMWHWQLATNRYRTPNSRFLELREML